MHVLQTTPTIVLSSLGVGVMTTVSSQVASLTGVSLTFMRTRAQVCPYEGWIAEGTMSSVGWEVLCMH